MTPVNQLVQLIQSVGVPVVMMLLFWLHIERVETKEMAMMQDFHSQNIRALNRIVRRLDRIELLVAHPTQTQVSIDEDDEAQGG